VLVGSATSAICSSGFECAVEQGVDSEPRQPVCSAVAESLHHPQSAML
jgi:hypothetical protein